MRRSNYLFGRLLWLALVATLPFLLLLIYNVQQGAAHAERTAHQSVANYAVSIARDTESLVVSTRLYLTYLAEQPLILAVDRNRCDPVLDGVVRRRAHFVNVLVLDNAGVPVCSAVKGPGAAPDTFAEYPWFRLAQGADSPALSKPFSIAQTTVTAMSHPLHDASRQRRGTVVALLSLQSLQQQWARYSLPGDSRLSVLDRDGTIMLSRPDFERWVGKDASEVVSKALQAHPGGVGRAPGIDGIERVFAREPLSDSGWQAFAALPASGVFAAYHSELRRNLIVGSSALAVAIALTLYLARRLVAPLQKLVEVTRVVSAGNVGVRASEDVPGEFREVALAFNAMLEAIGNAQVRERRQLDFYAALSRTNGAIVRITDEAELFQEICRICVDHGHASMAYVCLASGSHAKAVAWAGPAPEFLGDSDLSLDADRPEGRGMTATAIRTGKRCIVNDVYANPDTSPWRARGGALNTRAVAAFPVRRAGQVAGALTLHMTATGFFDDRVVELIDEVAGDLSFALDNFDRAADLRRTQQALVEREQQVTGLLETAMDAFITIDGTHRICLFNKAAAEMFGVPAAQALGDVIDRFIPTRLHEVHRRHVSSFAVTGSTARRMGALHTLVGVRGNGEEFPIEASISKQGEGSKLLMTVVIRDATELRRAEQARLAQVAAESASRAKTDFLSRMSHELRTPLNAVLGFSQLLQSSRHERLSAAQDEQVEHIRLAGWHLLALINDVLDVSQIEAGRLRVEERSVDVAGLVDEVFHLSGGAAKQYGVTLSTSCKAHDRLGVWADPVRLRQVLINLVSNGIKYNRPGGSVEVAVRREGTEIRIVVEDNGMGMTEQQLSHLYEPFNRLGREHAGVEGTGLGLALTRQLVLLMRGRMVVESQSDVGTRVELSLPVHDAEPASALPAAAEPGAGDALQADEPRGSVLYVEDNPVNMIVVESLLGRWPLVRLIQAHDGETGLQLAQTSNPDVVLLDMRLPDMDGLAVLKALRGTEAGRRLRVIALSASAMADDVEAARDAGADDYWTKPLDFELFLREMRRLLGVVELHRDDADGVETSPADL